MVTLTDPPAASKAAVGMNVPDVVNSCHRGLREFTVFGL
jgi:hypothetical protein